MVLQRRAGAVEALLIGVPERVQALLLGALEDTGHSVDTHVETLERGAERETHKMVAWGREEVAAVGRVDVEEDARNDDALLLETLLEEGLEAVLDGPLHTTGRIKTYQAVVERGRQVLQVEPDVEGRLWGNRDLEAETRKTLEDMVALMLKVLLQSEFFLANMLWVQKRDGSELQSNSRS